MGKIFAPILIAFALVPSRVFSSDARNIQIDPKPANPAISIHREHSNLRAQEVPLSFILREISSQTGLTFVFDPEADHRVSLNVEDVSLGTAIKHLLRNVNFAEYWVPMQEGNDAPTLTLSKIYVFPKGKSAPGMDAVLIRENSQPIQSILELPAAGPRESAAEPVGHAAILPDSTGRMDAYMSKKKMIAYLRKKSETTTLAADSMMDRSESAPDPLEAYLEKKKKPMSLKSSAPEFADP